MIKENGRLILAGVVNYLIGCKSSFDFPRLYNRVTYRKDWILENTEGTQDSNCDGMTETSTQSETSTQKIEGENPSHMSETEADAAPVAAIVGGSAAGLVLIAVILAGVWCWKKGTCQRNTENGDDKVILQIIIRN